MKKYKKLLNWYGLLLLFSIGWLLLWNFFPNFRIWVRGLISPTKKGEIANTLEADIIINVVQDLGGRESLGKMLAAKAFVETGRFTSSVYENNNNAFGMKCPRTRETLMVRCKNNYAYFNSLRDSVRDYFLWWKFHKIGIHALNYLTLPELLQKEKDYHYYTTDVASYTKKVNWFYERL